MSSIRNRENISEYLLHSQSMMFESHWGQMLRYFLSSLVYLSFTASANDLDWEESNWLGVRPNDVNPDMNKWGHYDKAFITTFTAGGRPSTVDDWVATNTNDLGMAPITMTVNGQVQVTSTTEYVQFAASTMTQGGSTAVETSMLIAPAIWSDIADAASTVCGGGTRKRQFCDLAKVDTETLAKALYNVFAKKEIMMGTLAILGFIEIMQVGALNRPAVHSWKITGVLPTPPATASDSNEAASTGWVDPCYTNELDLASELAAASGKSLPTSVAASTTSTSLACSKTGSATVNPSAAYSNIREFCGQQNHLVPINPTASTSQNFPELEINSTISISWASGCNSHSPPYTLNSNDCRTYLNDTINGCDNNSNDKHGGALTVDCIVYAMTPQTWKLEIPNDDPPPPPPDPTSIQLNCASATPNAATFSPGDASHLILNLFKDLGDYKVFMSGNSTEPNVGQSSGVTDNCGITSDSNKAISVGVSPSCEWTSKLLRYPRR